MSAMKEEKATKAIEIERLLLYLGMAGKAKQGCDSCGYLRRKNEAGP